MTDPGETTPVPPTQAASETAPAPRSELPGILFVALLLLTAAILFGRAATRPQPALPPALPPEPAETTTLLNEKIAGTATLRAEAATLDQPLTVFYQPGANGEVLPVGAVAGTLVDGDRSIALVRVPCPADLRPEAAAAVCLDAPFMPDAVGTYAGIVTIVPQWGDGVDEQAQAVEITVVTRRPALLFLLVALAGITFSLWATWFAGDYQQIRRLREACAAVAWTGKVCPGDPPPLTLEPRESACTTDLPPGFLSAHGLWLHSLLGDRPDYAAIEKEIQSGRDVDAAFHELCRVRGILVDDRDRIRNRSAQLGFAEPALAQRLETLSAPRTTAVPAADVVEMVASWRAVHQTAERWLATVAYLDDLCRAAREIAGRDDSTVCPPPLRGSEAGKLAEAHLSTAKQKLAVVTGESSWAALEPEADLRAAWLALNLYREQMDGLRRQFSLLQQGPAPLPESLPDPLDRLASLSDRWRGVGEWISETVAAWSPALNRGLILALFLLSLATTLLLGATQLYAGKPWGSWVDVLTLLLLGSGVHAGLTGLFTVLKR